MILAEEEIEDVEQRPAPRAELLRHHDHRHHGYPRLARLVRQPVPQPGPLLVVRKETGEIGLERLEIAARRRMRRRPVAVEDDIAVFDEGRPRLVGAHLLAPNRQAGLGTHPVVDRGARLDRAARARVDERPWRHAPTQLRDRNDFAVVERNGAGGAAHESAFAIGPIDQHPVDDGGEERLPRRLLALVGRVERAEVGLRRARRPVPRIPRQQVVAEAVEKGSVGPGDRLAVERLGHRVASVRSLSRARNSNVAEGARSRRCHVSSVMQSWTPRP